MRRPLIIGSRALVASSCNGVLNTQVDVQSEGLAEYAGTSVTVAAEVGSIHISSASASARLAIFVHGIEHVLVQSGHLTKNFGSSEER